MSGPPDRPVEDLINLGPVTGRMLPEVGVRTEADLRALGAFEVWRRLKFAFPRQINTVGLYALEGALRGLHWNRLPPDVKARLKAQADAYSKALAEDRTSRR